MTDCGFGDSAVRLCGVAATALGWRPAEFWRATPAELACAFMIFAETANPPDKMTVEALMQRFPDR